MSAFWSQPLLCPRILFPSLRTWLFSKNQLERLQQRVEDEVNSGVGQVKKVCLLPTTTTPSLLNFIIQYAFEWMVEIYLATYLFIEFLFFVTPKEHFPINGS